MYYSTSHAWLALTHTNSTIFYTQEVGKQVSNHALLCCIFAMVDVENADPCQHFVGLKLIMYPAIVPLQIKGQSYL